MTSWFREHSFVWGALLLFCTAFLLFVYVSNSGTFADPDSFYHVKLAQRIAEGQDIRDFPWLPFTTLADHYTDQHFLYHVFLAPFVAYLGAFTGAKLATTIIASVLVIIIVLVLRGIGVQYSLAWGFILLTLAPFIFRINLVKAPGFSLMLLFIGLLFAWKRWYIPLAITAFVYVWSYGGFILLPIFVLWLSILRQGVKWFQEKRWLAKHHIAIHPKWRVFLKKVFTKPNARVVWAVLIGTVVGVLVNPFFPQNLAYLNEQLIQIGIVNYQDIIGVGGEWYPQPFLELIANTIILTLLAVGAIVWSAIELKKISLRTWFFFTLFIFFFLFTLKSRRYVEYYAPFGLAFVACAYSDLLIGFHLKKFWRKLIAGASLRMVIFIYAFLIYCVIGLAVVIPKDIRTVKRDLSGGFSYTQTYGASQWLQANTPKNAIVVHSDWDEFPYLFFWNDHNKYIAGLDPTFLYRADEERYWAWVHLSKGELELDEISAVVTKTLQSNYVLVEKDHSEFLLDMQATPDFEISYEDEEAAVFTYIRE